MSPPLCKLQEAIGCYSTHSIQQHDVILLFLSLHLMFWYTDINSQHEKISRPLLCLNTFFRSHFFFTVWLLRLRNAHLPKLIPQRCFDEGIRTPTLRSTSQALSPCGALGSLGWGAWCPFHRGARNLQHRPDTCTGIYNCSGKTLHCGTPFHQIHK